MHVYVCGDPVPFYGKVGGPFYSGGEQTLLLIFIIITFSASPPGSQLLWSDSRVFTLKTVG